MKPSMGCYCVHRPAMPLSAFSNSAAGRNPGIREPSAKTSVGVPVTLNLLPNSNTLADGVSHVPGGSWCGE